MPEIGDQTTTPEGVVDGSSTEDPTAAPASTPSELELARRRQAGAEKARQEAEKQRDEAVRLAESLKAGIPADQQPVDMKALLKQAKDELKAEFEAEYSKKAETLTAQALDARFPAARAKFPSVTDAVQLAELEAVFGEAADPPTPVGNNQARGAGTGAKNPEDMTSAELQAYMRTLDPAVAGLVRRS